MRKGIRNQAPASSFTCSSRLIIRAPQHANDLIRGLQFTEHEQDIHQCRPMRLRREGGIGIRRHQHPIIQHHGDPGGRFAADVGQGAGDYQRIDALVPENVMQNCSWHRTACCMG